MAKARRDLRPVLRWIKIFRRDTSTKAAKLLVENIEKISKAVERSKLVRGDERTVAKVKREIEDRKFSKLSSRKQERVLAARAARLRQSPEYMAEIAEYHRQRQEKFEQQQKELEKVSEPKPEPKPEQIDSAKLPVVICNGECSYWQMDRGRWRPVTLPDSVERVGTFEIGIWGARKFRIVTRALF